MNEPICVSSPKEKPGKSIRYTWKGCLVALIILIGMTIGGILGLFIGDAVMATKIYPSWEKIDIPTKNMMIEEILSLNTIHTIPEKMEFSKDELFVLTEEKKPYMLNQLQWQSIQPLPDDLEIAIVQMNHKDLYALSKSEKAFVYFKGQWIPYDKALSHNIYGKDCASEWDFLPMIDGAVIDSIGTSNFGHDFDRFTRCYYLLEDGSLQLLSYSNSFNQQLVIYALGGFIGSLVGGIICFATIRRFRNHRMKGVS